MTTSCSRNTQRAAGVWRANQIVTFNILKLAARKVYRTHRRAKVNKCRLKNTTGPPFSGPWSTPPSDVRDVVPVTVATRAQQSDLRSIRDVLKYHGGQNLWVSKEKKRKLIDLSPHRPRIAPGNGALVLVLVCVKAQEHYCTSRSMSSECEDCLSNRRRGTRGRSTLSVCVNTPSGLRCPRHAELPRPNLHRSTDTLKHFPIGPLGQERRSRTE